MADPTILPAQPGNLLKTISAELLPPAEAPLPPLEIANVVDPPLPAVTNLTKAEPAGSSAGGGPTAAASPPHQADARANVANSGLSIVTMLVLAMLYIGH